MLIPIRLGDETICSFILLPLHWLWFQNRIIVFVLVSRHQMLLLSLNIWILRCNQGFQIEVTIVTSFECRTFILNYDTIINVVTAPIISLARVLLLAQPDLAVAAGDGSLSCVEPILIVLRREELRLSYLSLVIMLIIDCSHWGLMVAIDKRGVIRLDVIPSIGACDFCSFAGAICLRENGW